MKPQEFNLRRFESAKVDVGRVITLAADHPALVEGRTIFPKSVVASSDSPRLLVSGHNNPKLGRAVLKGLRTGWPIYQLTLEERATCPRSCAMWAGCYGGTMPYARRHRPDAGFFAALRDEVRVLASRHPNGLLVRLHTLGDFFSVAYVDLWASMLAEYPNLHAFGFTARDEDKDDAESRAIVVDADPKSPDVIMCPAQTEKTAACATCGLCWSEVSRGKAIGFLRHGMKRRAARPEFHHPRPDAAEVVVLSPGGRMSVKRPVASLNIHGVEPAALEGVNPEFRWVSPKELLVDETYQRSLADRSVKLIRKIVGTWDWRRFKPPIVAVTPEGYEVIDGQHTAIAAASHPGIDQIPVMIVHAPEQEGRAAAFIGHNRDRLGITPMQMHAAAVAAGDDDALTVAQVCERAGVRVLKVPPGNGAYKPGDTVAVAAIRALINRRGVIKAREVLQVLVKAHAAPVSQAGIRAVDMLLHEDEYAGQVLGDDIASTILGAGFIAEQEAKVFAAAHNLPIWKALGITLFKRSRRGRRRAA